MDLFSNILIKWTIYCFWILFTTINASTDSLIDPRCSLPQIQSHWSKLHVYYRDIPNADVVVYSCQYTVEDVCHKNPCSNCERGSEQSQSYSLRKYSDVSVSCLKSFDKNKFRPNKTSIELCHNDSYINRTISVTYKKYETLVNIIDDVIVLDSGNECKYSLGFCHDKKMGVDVMWRAKNNTKVFCDNLRELHVSEAYYFIINQKRHVVIHTKNGYSTWKLKDPKLHCGVITWNSEEYELLVSEGPVPRIRSISSERRLEYLLGSHSKNSAFFAEKQQVYDFLLETCLNELSNDSKSSGDVENLTLPKDKQSSNENDYPIMFHSTACYYLVVINSLCFVSILLYLVCSTYKKIYCNVNCKSKNHDSALSEAYGINLYDTVLT